MKGDILASGGRKATWAAPNISQERWDEIFGSPFFQALKACLEEIAKPTDPDVRRTVLSRHHKQKGPMPMPKRYAKE